MVSDVKRRANAMAKNLGQRVVQHVNASRFCNARGSRMKERPSWFSILFNQMEKIK
jgi:hypothetical protein